MIWGGNVLVEEADEGTAVAQLTHRSKGQTKDTVWQDPSAGSYGRRLMRAQLWPHGTWKDSFAKFFDTQSITRGILFQRS